MKKITFAIFTLILAIIAIPNVLAAQNAATAQSASYPMMTLGSRDTYSGTTLYASNNYKWAMNYVHTYSGNAALHTEYYLKYDNGTVAISGNDMALNSGGGALWYSSNNNSNPAVWTIMNRLKCTGAGTTGNYCGLSGNTYLLKVMNKNYIYSFTANGQLTLTN